MSLGVIHLLPELEQGGVEDHVAALAGAQAEAGARVAVVSGGGRLVSSLSQDVEHITLPVGQKNLFTGIGCARKIASLARERGAQIIHAHSRVPGWVAWFAQKFCPSLKFVYTVHAIFSKNLGTWPISRADAALCVSKSVRDDLMYRLARVPIVRVQYNALPKAVVPWRGSGGNVHSLLFAGRLAHNKNAETIIRALAPLRDKDWRLDILGDGPLRGDLEMLAASLGIDDKVAFLGYVGDVPRRMAECDLFLFPSLPMEGLSLVLIEALAAGVPTLASDIPQDRELASPNDEPDDVAALLPPTDVDAWTRAIGACLNGERPPTRLKVHLPTNEELAQNVMELYEEVLSGHKVG